MQYSPHSPRQRNIVGRAIGYKLVKKPQPLLCWRKHRFSRFRQRSELAKLVRLANMLVKLDDGWIRQHNAKRNANTEFSRDVGSNADGLERLAAQIQEGVGYTHRIDVKNLLPYLHQSGLGRKARLNQLMLQLRPFAPVVMRYRLHDRLNSIQPSGDFEKVRA